MKLFHQRQAFYKWHRCNTTLKSGWKEPWVFVFFRSRKSNLLEHQGSVSRRQKCPSKQFALKVKLHVLIFNIFCLILAQGSNISLTHKKCLQPPWVPFFYTKTICGVIICFTGGHIVEVHIVEVHFFHTWGKMLNNRVSNPLVQTAVSQFLVLLPSPIKFTLLTSKKLEINLCKLEVA